MGSVEKFHDIQEVMLFCVGSSAVRWWGQSGVQAGTMYAGRRNDYQAVSSREESKGGMLCMCGVMLHAT